MNLPYFRDAGFIIENYSKIEIHLGNNYWKLLKELFPIVNLVPDDTTQVQLKLGATNDKVLRTILKREGIATIYLRGKNRLEMTPGRNL